jgi:hypothetical protein
MTLPQLTSKLITPLNTEGPQIEETPNRTSVTSLITPS